MSKIKDEIMERGSRAEDYGAYGAQATWKAIISTGFLILVVVGLVVFFSGENRKDAESKARMSARVVAESVYEGCKEDADANYAYKWNQSCKALGHGDRCSLSLALGTSYETEMAKAKSICLEEYAVSARY